MKYSYWFEDTYVAFTDHELSVKEMCLLRKKHGFLVGYTAGDEVYLMDNI